MAARLNKKFFGNRNIGTGGDQTTGNLSNSQNYNDDRIGGEGVASVTVNTVGSYTTALPTATFSTPDLPGGVRATGIVHGNGLSAATTTNGTGYYVGDVLTVVGGTKVAAATFPVSAIVGLGTPGITNGGSLYDVTNGTEGDRVTFTHANLSQALRVRVTAVSGSIATSIAVEQQGIWTGAGAFPTSMAGGVNGFTATTTARSGGDNTGTGLVLSFTGSNWGLYSFGTVVVQGDYTVAASNPASFSGGNGTGAAATITYGISGIVVTEKGSGYTTVADAGITFSSGTAAATPVLTTDDGIPYSAGNQENALIPYAYIGGSRKIVDIIGQKGARRYKVTDGTNVGLCNLKTSAAANAAGEMDLTAYDSAGGEYWVKKINNRRCTVVRKAGGSGGTQFATDSSVPWTLDAATVNTTVKINNA
jgi:hypothetical protein